MSVGPVVEMSVDDQGTSRSPPEQVQLIVDREVIEESEAKHDVVLLQVHFTDVRLEPRHSFVLRESLRARIHAGDRPSKTGGLPREASVACAQIDTPARGEQAQE